MLSKDEVQHIAELARIGLSENDLEKYTVELSSVLDWVDKLKEADIEAMPRKIHSAINIFREDEAVNFLEKDKLIDLFPEKKERFNKVRSVF